jgi:predicted nucleic acid-binding protein
MAAELELPGGESRLRLKARRAPALADCFAVATAAAHGASLLTGDPEILEASGLPCPVEDLRPA